MIANVQALRAAAAFLIVFVHAAPLLRRLGLPSFGLGGVDVFFVISGFIMVYTTRGANVSAETFLLHRLARIAPTYWLLTLVVFAIVAVAPRWFVSTRANPIDLIKSLMFVPFVKANGSVHPTLFVGWTLNYEMFFYTLFSMGLFFPRRVGAMLTIGALGILVVVGAVYRPSDAIEAFYTKPIILEFAAGMSIAFCVEKLPSLAASHWKYIIAAIGASGFLVVLLAPAHLQTILPGATLLVASAVALERWGWAIRSTAVGLVGDASYSIYLTHPFVVLGILHVYRGLAGGALVGFGMIVLILGCVLLVGITFHRAVERPLVSLARGFVDRWQLPQLRRAG